MGVNAVLMVENRRNITLEEFICGMQKDEWGKRYCKSFAEDESGWVEFEWEGRHYFSMQYCNPRYFRLLAKEYDFESGKFYEYDNPDFDYAIQVSFLKAVRIAEELAGGPVYFGNDVVSGYQPPEKPEHDEFFHIPFELENIIENWREIADTKINPDELFSKKTKK